MPTPREAAAILRARFPGLAPEAPDDDRSVAYGDPTGALALSQLRDDRAGELEDQLIRQESAALIPTDGYVQGDPGRRMRSNAVAASNAIETRKRLTGLNADAAADPFTGVAEQARTKGIQTTLDAAATAVRPEVDDAARAVATRNAFGEYLKSKGMKMGEFEAASSPAALAAAETPLHAQASDVGERLAKEKFDRDLQLTEAHRPPVKLTAQEQSTIDAAKTAEDLAPEMLQRLEMERAGIGADPTQYASWTDVLPAWAGKLLYSHGLVRNENRDRIDQLTGYLEASLPAMLRQGRLNQKQYEDLKLHVPQLGLSDGANYLRTKYILERILPSVVGGIESGHPDAFQRRGSPTGAASPGGNRRDPNRGMEGR